MAPPSTSCYIPAMIFLAKARMFEHPMVLHQTATGRNRMRSAILGPHSDYGSMLDHDTYGIISGERGHLSHGENLERTHKIYAALREAGHSPAPAEGHYGGVPEKSWLIKHPDPEHLHKVLRGIGHDFEQESYIVRHNGEHRMVYPNGDSEHHFPFYRRGTPITHNTPSTEDRTSLWTPGGHIHTFRMEDMFDNPHVPGLGKSERGHVARHFTLHTPDGPHHFIMHFDPTPIPLGRGPESPR